MATNSPTVRSGIEHILQANASTLSAPTIFLGILFHAIVLRKLQPEDYLYRFVGTIALTAAALAWSCASLLGTSAGLSRAGLIALCFNAGVFFSISIYRLFLHPLRRFPGPVGARLSRFYVTAAAAKDVKYHKVVRGWHEKYGDLIRTGPRELAVIRKSAVPLIYGHTSECIKSTWYTQVTADPTQSSVHMCRDWRIHKQRRKAWDRSLSLKALSTYEPLIVSRVERFLDQIKSRSTLDATRWSMLLTFDIMGDVGLGKDFGGMETGIEHPAIKAIHDHMTILGIMSTVPWLLNLMSQIPGATRGYAPFFSWCSNEVKAKQQKWESDKQPQDIISWLVKAYQEKDVSAPPSEAALHDDSRVVVIAGSDTTATTLAAAFYYLSKHPHILTKLQSHLDAAMPHREWSHERAKSVPYVDDIIQETLRLKPAVLTGGYRVTPQNGILVDGVHIPGNTNVFVPIQQIQTDPRYYKRAEEFVPERYGERRKEWATDQQPWIPFSIGPYSCPGKSLAMSTLRIALSQIALQFDITFAPGETGREFDEEARDTFTTNLRPLMLKFTPRR